MTKERAAEIGKLDGVDEVDNTLYDQQDGLERLRGSLLPHAESWDAGARNATAARYAGIPVSLWEVYYDAYQAGAVARAREILAECDASSAGLVEGLRS